MATEPIIIPLGAQPYVGIRQALPMARLAELADRTPEVFGWLADHDLAPAGAPFFRYHVIDMDGLLDVEVGVPVAAEVAGDGAVRGGVLPAGRYASVVHIGHPDELLGVTTDLLKWAEGRGLRWDSRPTDRGETWGSRLESYQTDPTDEPDLRRWQTQLLFRLAD